MRVYLNVSCLNRPFDDQSQMRIRLEAEAVALVLKRFDDGIWEQIASEIADVEIAAISDEDRRGRVKALLQDADVFVKLDSGMSDRAKTLMGLGFKPADALHVASAEAGGAEVLLSCDDRFCRTGVRSNKKLKVRIANPLDWLKELGYGPNP